MKTYIIEINELQMSLIEKALKALKSVNDLDQRMDQEESEELDILFVGLTETVRPTKKLGWSD